MMLSDYENMPISEAPATGHQQEATQERRRRRYQIHTDDTSSDEEIASAERPGENQDQEGSVREDELSVRDRIASGEVPLDILERQRNGVPPGAYVLTE